MSWVPVPEEKPISQCSSVIAEFIPMMKNGCSRIPCKFGPQSDSSEEPAANKKGSASKSKVKKIDS